MTAVLEGVSGQQHTSAAFYPRERAGTLCTGGWVGPSGVPRGVWGVQIPEIPKAVQNVAKLNPIVKTVKNC